MCDNLEVGPIFLLPGAAAVFRQYDNSKQAIAMLAILLALSPGAQHAHLFCHLGGCSPPLLELAGSDGFNKTAGTCSHSHECQYLCQEKKANLSPSRQGDGAREQDSSCPCPVSCWCHQSPQPFDLPKDASQPFELLRGPALCQVTTMAADRGKISLLGGAQAVDAPNESAVHRCAELCRFLI